MPNRIRNRAVARMIGTVAAVLSRVSIANDDLLLAAISGGSDSVALLHALAATSSRFGHRIAAAHLNHGLRGRESDNDERFVRELCHRAGVHLVVERAESISPNSSNLEEQARELRHEFLERTADLLGARFIALAHHADDQAETVLMRILRGSGTAGLAAMAEAGPGRLLRPMLMLRRAEIMAYLDAIGAHYVTDSSNKSLVFLRNRVRGELVPMIEREYAPGFSRRLVELSSEMRMLDGFVSRMARDELSSRLVAKNRLRLARLLEVDPVLVRALVREFIRVGAGSLRRIGRVHIEAAVRLCVGASPGARVILPGRWQLRREYDCVVLEPVPQQSCSGFTIELVSNGETIVEAAGFAFESRGLDPSARSAVIPGWRPASPMEAFFDATRLGDRLMVRNYMRGDRVRPFGTAGTRKVHDVFVDLKVPRSRRVRWPLIVAGNEIIWIPGLVRGRSAPVTEQTRKVMYLRARPLPNDVNLSLLVN